jgi:hypothetical protein
VLPQLDNVRDAVVFAKPSPVARLVVGAKIAAVPSERPEALKQRIAHSARQVSGYATSASTRWRQAISKARWRET